MRVLAQGTASATQDSEQRELRRRPQRAVERVRRARTPRAASSIIMPHLRFRSGEQMHLNQNQRKAAFGREEETAAFRVEADIITLQELRSENAFLAETRHHISGIREGCPV